MGILSRAFGGRKHGYPIKYAVTFHGAYNVLPGVRELKVQLKRGSKAAYTVVRSVQQGEVVWEEMVPLTTSLYADVKTGQYEAKEMTFHLKEPGHGGQKDRTYASVTLDVANFAPQEGPTSSPSEFKVVLFQGTREIQTHLHLTIQSQWLTDDSSEYTPSISDVSTSDAGTAYSERAWDEPHAAASTSAPASAAIYTHAQPRAQDHSLAHAYGNGNGNDVAADAAPIAVAGSEDQLKCGQAATFRIRAADMYGNTMTKGGERPSVSLVGPKGSRAQHSVVTQDFNDGSYGVTLTPDKPGSYKFTVTFNDGGTGVTRAFEAISMHATKSAMDCVLRGEAVALTVGGTVTGSTATLFVQSQFHEAGDRLTGMEPLSVRVLAPSGGVMAAPLTFERGRYLAPLYWPETGKHTVDVKLAGEDVPGSPFVVHASPQQLYLPVCHIFGAGLTEAVAGERAVFVIEAHDARGNRITTGKAAFGLTADSDVEAVKGVVVDRGDGSYEAAYTVHRAGPFVLTLTHGGASASFEALCTPGKVHVPSCVVVAAPDGPVVVGEPTQMVIARCDAHGNRVKHAKDPVQFTAPVSGPGTSVVRTFDQLDGSCVITFTTDVAGVYSVPILGGTRKELVPGTPLMLPVEPGPPEALRMTVSLEGATLARSSDTDAHEVVEAVAGRPLTLTVHARDSHGNSTLWEKGHVNQLQVFTEYPNGELATTQLKPLEVNGGKLLLEGTFSTAETIVLHVRYADAVLPTWPRILQVVAGLCEPNQCVVFAPEPAQPLWCEPFEVRVQTRDAFENLLPGGGDYVDGFLDGPQGQAERPTSVQDHGNGTYTMMCSLGAVGEWVLRVLVNGQGEHRYRIAIQYGVARASTVALALEDSDAKRGVVQEGALSTVTVQPHDQTITDRRLRGDEAVMVRLTAPSGATVCVPLQYAPETGSLSGPVAWVEPGTYVVMGLLDREHLINSPLTVQCLPASRSQRRRAAKNRRPSAQRVRALGAGDDDQFYDEYADDGSIPDEDELLQMSRAEAKDPDLANQPDVIIAAAAMVEESSEEEEIKQRLITEKTKKKRTAKSAAAAAAAGKLALGVGDELHDLDDVGRARDLPRPLLSKCLIQGEGGSRCVAGKVAAFTLVGKDRDGRALGRGGANITATVVTCKGDLVKAEVTDLTSGKWNVRYTVTLAGPCAIVLKCRGQERQLRVECVPAECCPAECVVDASELQRWKSGAKAGVHIQRRDRFRNVITAKGSNPRMTGSGTGPAKVDCSSKDHDDGTCTVWFLGTTKGLYQLTVMEATSKNHVAGSPFTAALGAGPPSLKHCEVMTLPALGAKPPPMGVAKDYTPYNSKGRKGVAHCVAGEAVELAVKAVDAAGNATMWAPDALITLTTLGPTPVNLAETRRDGSTALFRHTFSKAGGYSLNVMVDGQPVVRGDKVLMVAAGRPDAARCLLDTGALPGGFLVCHEPQRLVVQAVDAYGNLCGVGGDRVSLLLRGPGQREVKTGPGEDMEDGTYAVPTEVDFEGTWKCQVVVGGRPATRGAHELPAVWGKLKAREVRLSGGGSDAPDGILACGVTAALLVQTADGGAAARRMMGNEAVVARLFTPTGVAEALPLHFVESTGRYQAKVTLTQAGQHTVAVLLDGEHVHGSPYSVVATAAALWLPACRLVGAGLQRARAGETTVFSLQAADRSGNAIQQGGANLTASVSSDGEVLPVKVKDNDDGTYSALFQLHRAGPYKITLQSGNEQRSELGECSAGVTSVPHCLLSAPTHQWVAGQPAALRVRRHDADGNAVPFSGNALPQFAVRSDGPAPITSSPHELGDGTLELRCVAPTVGDYVMSVYGLHPNGAPGAEVADSPVVVSVAPGPVDALRCTARFGPDMEELETTGYMVVAGEYVEVIVEPHDAFGNVTGWLDSLAFHVTADGPDTLQMPQVAPSSTLALPEFGAVFKRAGTYLVRATAGRFNIDGWPKLLQVLPGPVAPPRCSIRGGATADKAARPLQDVVADAPVKIMLRTADDFGNLRSEGGDRVQCTLDSVRGHSAPVEVVDLGDGTYSIGFTVTAVGRWILHVLVNGTPVKDKGWEFNVADGPMAPDALQLVLDPAEARSGVFSCGAVSAVFAQVVDPERMMTGKEAVSLRMTSPSGVSTMMPLTLAESRGFYSSQCPWSEVGEFVVEITLDGLQIVNSPLAVQVMPQLVHLPTCTIEWASSNRGRAGIPLKFAVQAYDARGNRIERGGETIWYEVLHEDRVINPKVPAVDQGLGRYEGVVCLEEVSAVPYQVQLSMDGEIPVKQCPVSCSPADTHFPQCVVDVRETLQITAGAWSSFYILRNDRFGNPVTIGEEGEHHAPPLDGRTTKSKALLSSSNTYAPPFYVDVGDTPVAVDLVEQVGGRCEVRLMSPRAGSYTLHVYGETPVVPGARPPQGSDKLQPVQNGVVEVKVNPALLCPGASLAWVAGIDGEEHAPPSDELAVAMVQNAGDPLTVCVLPQDALGNMATWTGQVLEVTAHGPVTAELVENTSHLLSMGGHGHRIMQGALTKAGSYTLTARVDSVAPAGWPRTLQLVPGRVHPHACVIKGPALSGAIAGEPTSLVVVGADRFHNPASRGGAPVELVLMGPDDQPNMVVLQTIDNGDGTYGAEFELTQPGRWDAAVTMDGNDPDPAHAVSFYAQPGSVSAVECLVQRDESRGPRMEVYQGDTFYVGTLDEHRLFTGQELVLLHVNAPSGGVTQEALQFDAPSQVFWVEHVWLERGTHRVSATINGTPVSNAPLMLKVLEPGDDGSGIGRPEFVGSQRPAQEDPRAAFTPEQNRRHLAALTPEQAGDELQQMLPGTAAKALEKMPPNKAAAMVDAMMASALTNLANPEVAYYQAADVLNEMSHEVGEEVMSSLVKKDRVRATNAIQAFMTGSPEAASVILTLMCSKSMDAAQEVFSTMVDDQLLKLLRASTEEQCGMFMSIMDGPTLVRALQSTLTHPHGGLGVTRPWTSADEPEASALLGKLARGSYGLAPPANDVAVRRLAKGFSNASKVKTEAEVADVLRHNAAEEVAVLCLLLSPSRMAIMIGTLPEPLKQEVIEALAQLADQMGVDLGPRVALGQSVLHGEGLSRAVAGEPAVFWVETYTAKGERITVGGAAVRVTVAPAWEADVVGSALAEVVPARIQDDGSGKYMVTYELQVAGEYQAIVEVEGLFGGEPVEYTPECVPGPVDLNRCRVDWTAAQQRWVAGEWVEMRVQRCDRFGNVVIGGDADQLPVIGGEGTGPAEMESEVSETGDGGCSVSLMTTVAGEYSVTVWGFGTSYFGGDAKVPLGGSPLQVTVVASELDPRGSALVVLGARVINEDTVAVTAGATTSCDVRAQDEFGNATDWPATVAVEVLVREIDQSPFSCVERSYTTATFAAPLYRAGLYQLHAAIDGTPIGHKPKLLQVDAAAPDAAHSVIQHKLEANVTCGTELSLTVVTRDHLDNACTRGGAAVDVGVEGGERGQSVQSRVTDHKDGTYAVAFRLPEPGTWRLAVYLNNAVMECSQLELTASYGPMAAGEVVLSGGGLDELVTAGTVVMLSIAAAHARPLLGNELLAVTVVAPSKVRQGVAVVLGDGARAYTAALPFSEVGRHTVEVQLASESVRGAPFTVDVLAQEFHLPNCIVQSPDATNTCVAGVEKNQLILCRDRHGNPMKHGGKHMTMVVLDSTGRPHEGAEATVKDNLDGTYTATHRIRQAGPYTLQLTTKGNADPLVRHGRCLPGPTSVPNTRVDTVGLGMAQSRWMVGRPLAVRVVRYDAFGNCVTQLQDTVAPKRFTADATGPGQVLTELLEVGDGSFEVRLVGRKAGRYMVAVQCGSQHVVGSPFEAVLQPSRPTAYTCRTSISGVQQAAGSSAVLLARAGDTLGVEVEPLDQYGNVAAWQPDQRVTVEVACPSGDSHMHDYARHMTAEFTRSLRQGVAKGVDGASSVDLFTGVITVAGSYMMCLRLNQQVIAGWPRILEITPSTLDGGHVQLDLTREIGEPTEGPRDARTLEMENEALRLKLATLERRGGR